MTISLKVRPVEVCLNLALAAMSPLQAFIDQPGITHEFCNHQALQILRNDGLTRQADFFSRYLKELNLGVFWADKGWRNAHHYFEPCTGRGLWQFTDAVESFNLYYHLASSAGKNGDCGQAIFFLGAAAHLVQDLCVPHHARAKLFCGHQQYESWVQKHFANFAVVAHGTYNEGRSVSSLLLSNAHTAADFFDWVKDEGDKRHFTKATEILLSLAQRTTAGLLWQFASELFAGAQKTEYIFIPQMTVA